jgi:hypothetical protein
MACLQSLEVFAHDPEINPLLRAKIVLAERIPAPLEGVQKPDVVEPGGRLKVTFALRTGRADFLRYAKSRREAPGAFLDFLRRGRALG